MTENDTSFGCKPASTPKPSTSLVKGNKPRSMSTAGSSKLSSRVDLGAGGMNLGVKRYTKECEKELRKQLQLKRMEQYSEFANDDSSDDDESVKVTQPKLARNFSSQKKSMKPSTTRDENTPRAASRTNVVSTQKKTEQSGWTTINRKPIEILNTQKRVSKQRGMPIPFPDWPFPGGCAGGCIDLYEEEEKLKKRKRAEIGFRHSDEDSDYENDGEEESDHSE